MLKSLSFTLSLACCVIVVTPAIATPLRNDGQPRQQTSGQQQPDRPRGILPSEFNVRIDSDVRTFVVMAAINAAGFDYETGGQPLTPARAELRRDLAKLDPALKARLAAFYKSHRRQQIDEGTDALRYAALSLLMTEPPSFEIYVPHELIPEDLRPLLERDGKRSNELSALVSEFYIKGGIRQLVPKYTQVANAYGAAYHQAASLVIHEVLNYFHTAPETVVRMKPLVIESRDAARGSKTKQTEVARIRTRQVFVVPDPLAAYGVSVVRDDLLNQREDLLSRRIGDDYIVIAGPSRIANGDAMRQALIRFVIDPLVERHLKASLDYKDPIVALVAKVPTAAKQFGTSVYLVLRESLARAAEARMRRIAAQESAGSYSEEDAIYDLSQAYLRGAVLAFHVYDSLKGLETVGISIEDFYDQMVSTTNFEREAGRPKQFEAVVARVSANRAARPANTSPEPETAAGALTRKLVQSSDHIRDRRFAEAKPLLEEVLVAAPSNARALFGMAQVVNNMPSPVETDAAADENDKIQAQYDRFKAASNLYRRAIANASLQSELWLVQWCHVMIGRLLDFQDFREDAVAEYEKAISLGEVPDGAYKEALEGKQRPYGRPQ
jgi:hypothetical protein